MRRYWRLKDPTPTTPENERKREAALGVEVEALARSLEVADDEEADARREGESARTSKEEASQELGAADAAVFATPVYFSDLSESLRAFLDRLRRTCMHKDGKAGIEGTQAVGVCVAGGGGGGAPACCVSLEKILAICGFDVVDMIPVRRQNLEAKLTVLEHTGLVLAGGQEHD